MTRSISELERELSEERVAREGDTAATVRAYDALVALIRQGHDEERRRHADQAEWLERLDAVTARLAADVAAVRRDVADGARRDAELGVAIATALRPAAQASGGGAGALAGVLASALVAVAQALWR